MVVAKSILILCSFAVFNVVHSQRVVNFKSSGVYFKNLGDLKIQRDVFMINTHIDLSVFHNASDLIDNFSVLFRAQCDPSKNSTCESDLFKLKQEEKEISSLLENLYQILGKNNVSRRRKRRDLSSIGNSLATQSLNMASSNSKSIADVSNELDQIRSTFQRNIDIIKSEQSSQAKIDAILNDGNAKLDQKIKIHETKLNDAVKRIPKIEQNLKSLGNKVKLTALYSTLLDFEVFCYSLKSDLREIKQSILDLQKHLLHFNIISPEEFMRLLQSYKGEYDFLANSHLQNYNKILPTLFLEASLHEISKTILIFIGVPLYTHNDRLYEVISVPLIKDNKILNIRINDKYCVIKENKKEFYCMEDEHEFFKIDDFYVCHDDKMVSFLPTTYKNKCIINIFKGRSLNSCVFIEIPYNIEAFQKLETNTYLFALRDTTNYTYNCNGKTNNGSLLSGTGILGLNYGCKFITDETTLNSDLIKSQPSERQRDIYMLGMDNKIEEEFKSHNFSKVIPQEKTLVKLEAIQLLRLREIDDD
ncbi:hypothetical protein ACFFRR_008942 [Megaselia abdita]